MIRVVIADDEALIRTGLRLILDAEPDITVVGEAQDGREAVTLARELQPDVVLMDVQMPDLDGIAATRSIVESGHDASRVLILTTFDRDPYVYAGLNAGASGFLLKAMPAVRLVDAVRRATTGETLLAPAITRRLVKEFVGHERGFTHPLPGPHEALSQRELEVLRELARGHGNAEIAERLFLSEKTVKTYITRILAKLDLRDRVQAVVYAYSHGLVDTRSSAASSARSTGIR